MIRQFLCMLACSISWSYAVPQDPVATDPAIVPTVVPTPFPYSHHPFAPGLNTINPYYNNYKYNPAGPTIPILTYSNEHKSDGSYSYSFSTADGKQAQEIGFLKDAYVDNNGEPQGTQVVEGSYSYVSPEGTPVQVSYVADENGFRPSGVHIPADSKALPPLPFLDGRNSTVFDPVYNRYNPYYNRLGAYNHHYNGRYQHDGRYPYDPTRYQYDPKYRYDARYRYDPRYRYDGRHHYDPRYPYDARRHYDARYNPYYHGFNPLHPTPLPNLVKEEPKQE